MSTLKYWLLVTLNELGIAIAVVLIIISIYIVFIKDK